MQVIIWQGVIQTLGREELRSRGQNVRKGVGGGQNALASPYTTSTLERGSCSGFGRYQAVETYEKTLFPISLDTGCSGFGRYQAVETQPSRAS